MKKLRLLSIAALSAFGFSLSAQSTADMGTDWVDGLVPAESGVVFAQGVTSYSVGDNVTFTIGGEATGAKADSKSVYSASMGSSISYADLKADQTHFFEGKVTEGFKITAIKINGTGSKLTAEGIIAKPSIVFSDESDFNEKRITGYADFVMSPCRGADADGIQPVEFTTIPEGTKSFRIYRKINLTQEGDVYKDDAEGEIAVSGGGDNVRLAYAKITYEEAGPVQKKAIAYVTTVPVADAGDLAIMEKLGEAYEVTAVNATLSGIDYSSYEAIVMAALPNSTAEGLKELVNFTKPIVILKPWMFIAGSGRWSWGVPENIEAATIDEMVNTVVVENASHPIFDGMNLTNGSDVVMATNSSHAKFRILIPITSWLDGNEANVTNLATVKGSAQEGKVVIGEIPVGSTMSGTLINHKNIFIGVSEAANSYLTADYLTIVKNSVDYVLDPGGGSSIENEKIDNSNKMVIATEYYDLMGKKLGSKEAAPANAILIQKSVYEDGSVGFQKIRYVK